MSASRTRSSPEQLTEAADRDADARSGEDFLPATHADWRSHGLLDAFGNAHGVTGIADVVQENRELVAAESRQRVVDGILWIGGGRSRDEVVTPQGSRHPADDLDQESVSCRMTEAVVDHLEPIQIDEHHCEGVLRVPNPPPAGALQTFHEEGPVGELRQVIVKRIVKQALLRDSKARAHFIERHRHRRRFSASGNRHLASPVTGRDVLRRGREILERPAHASAEEHTAADRQYEDCGAGGKQAATHFVDELLRGAPVLEQHQTSRGPVGVAGGQRKDSNDVPPVADLLDSVQRAESRQPVPGRDESRRAPCDRRRSGYSPRAGGLRRCSRRNA